MLFQLFSWVIFIIYYASMKSLCLVIKHLNFVHRRDDAWRWGNWSEIYSCAVKNVFETMQHSQVPNQTDAAAALKVRTLLHWRCQWVGEDCEAGKGGATKQPKPSSPDISFYFRRFFFFLVFSDGMHVRSVFCFENHYHNIIIIRLCSTWFCCRSGNPRVCGGKPDQGKRCALLVEGR